MTINPRSWTLAATTLFLVLSAGVSYSNQNGQVAPARDEMRKILAEGHENRAKRWQTKDEAAQETLDAALRPILGRARLGLQELPPGRGDQVRFARVVLNSTGAGFDAVRFRTPATGEEFNLVWEIVVPGSDQSRNLQGWNIVSLDGPAPVADYFSRRDDFELPGAGFPAENFCISQFTRGQPLRPDSEYILWFDFKNDQPTPTFVKVGLTAVEADEDATPRRSAAPKALRAFQASMRSLAQRYDAELKGLGKSYLAALDKAAKTASQQNDAAEVDRINGEADEIRRGEAAAAGRRGFQLLRAHYGIDGRWVDVADQLRPLIRGNVLRFGLGTDLKFKEDPAYGVVKRLILVYSLDGNTGVSITSDQQRVELPPTAPILDRIPSVGSYKP